MSGASPVRPWRPDEVRRKDFTVRLRGYDSNEIRGFLNTLADDLARLHDQLGVLRRENGELRADLEHAQVDLQRAQTDLEHTQVNTMDQVTDQAVQLLDQAQQLADALIDEAMQSSRDLVVAARSRQREIVESEPNAGHRVIERVPVAPPDGDPSAYDVALPTDIEEARVEDIRMYAKVAHVQFRTVLDAISEQAKRISQPSGAEDVEALSESDGPKPRSAIGGRRRRSAT